MGKSDHRQLEPTETHPGRYGITLDTGNPGNRW